MARRIQVTEKRNPISMLSLYDDNNMFIGPESPKLQYNISSGSQVLIEPVSGTTSKGNDPKPLALQRTAHILKNCRQKTMEVNCYWMVADLSEVNRAPNAFRPMKPNESLLNP